MSNDDILCEKPGPGGRVCTLPYGHQPENIHAFEVELPTDLGTMIDGIMQQTEEARERYEKAYRRTRITWWVMLGVVALYTGLVALQVFG